MSQSRRTRILLAIRTRLAAIKQADGFQTNVGLGPHVAVGFVPELGPDDPDVYVAVILGDEEVTRNGENVAGTTPIEILAIAKADLDEPYLAAEDVLSDIKKAVELQDRSLDGLVRPRIERGVTRTLPREPGTTTVAVSITYLAPYAEAWGQP